MTIRYARAAEADLAASEERFRLAFDRASIAKSLADASGQLLHVNDAYCHLLGFTREELEAGTFHQLTHPGDREATQAFIRWLVAGNGTSYRMEKRYLGKDGRIVWGDMNTVLLRDASGHPLRFITDIVDITARKELEGELQALNEDLEDRVGERTRQLQSANEELEAFAYSVAHDLRAPLRALSGFSELLARNPPAALEPAQARYLERIHTAARDMNGLIDDLLRLSHVGEEGLATQPVDLAALAREVFALCLEREPGRTIALATEPCLPVDGDPRLLRVLLENLIGNAWKFTGKQAQPSIEVGRQAAPPWAYFVKDNGVGFNMAQAERIFAPFQRLHPASEFPGTGIGLALAKRIVGRHGGRIWAQSEPGAGATIYFTVQGQDGPTP